MSKKEVLRIDCVTCEQRRQSIFCTVGAPGLDKLNQEKNVDLYKKGQRLFLEGEKPLGLYCVHTGRVKVVKTDMEGKETIVRIIGGGGVIGHRSLFGQGTYSASATVMEEGKVCFVKKETVQELMKSDPLFFVQVMKTMSKEMGEAEDKLASMARKSVRERFAEMLLMLKDSFGVKEAGRLKLDIKLTREEMASIIGAASENVTRLVTEYKNLGLLEQEGKVLFLNRIQDIEKEAGNSL